jgi:hypothetical protein
MALMMTGCQGLGRFTCVVLISDAMAYYMEKTVGAGDQAEKMRLVDLLSIVIILTNGGKNLTLPEILNFRHPQCRF